METQGSLRLLRKVSGLSGKFFDLKSGNPEYVLKYALDLICRLTYIQSNDLKIVNKCIFFLIVDRT